MADYQASANAVLDPQMAAEQQSLASQYQTNSTALTNEGMTYDKNAAGYNAAVDPYAQGESAAKTAFNDVTNKLGTTYSQHGIFNTGLIGNDVRTEGEKYATSVNQLEATRAQKLTDLASRKTGLTATYQSGLGQLSSKYQGLKAAYMQKAEAADAANSAKVQAASIRANSKGTSVTASRTTAGYGYDTVAQRIQKAANSGQGWGDTAKELAAAGYDPSGFDQVFKQAYGTRSGDAAKYGYSSATAAQERRAYMGGA